ncbi:MAG: ATP-dependent DNA helicase RecG [Spirochaetales bacterium]|nr:ATP-dependent DNA helicase RecG [Candidatus Physcosoma equi]
MGGKITDCPGVGKALAAEFGKLGVFTLQDVLFLMPRAYDDRREERTLRMASIEDPTVNCRITVLSHSSFPSKKGKTLKVLCMDDDGKRVELLCFNRPFLERQLRIGSEWYLNATVQKNYSTYQTAAFDLKRTREESGLGMILPIYPLAGNLKQNNIRKAVRYALDTLSPMEDQLPPYIQEKYHLLPFGEALEEIHFPTDDERRHRAHRTLAFGELLLMELAVLRDKAPHSTKSSRPTPLEKKFLSSLPFSLTPDQEKSIEEIREDLDGKSPMVRLLQGDVGSGKTLIAWLSALHVISKGGQVAFMAPTELLARQHADKAAELLSPLGVRISFITGDVKGKDRRLLLKALEEGSIDLAIGTHALFSQDVNFKKLSYIIIDEQHRFGVAQREALRAKGLDPDVLSMTATPIPRTLAMTMFADMDVSTIKTMPGGRKAIRTFTVGSALRDKMYESVGVEFTRGHQAYFVYPRIDDEGESDLRDVTTMFSFLQKKYPGIPSALIHSKLDEDVKMKILKDFREKKLAYLVSTSVVEVGIDIPDATCMIIEHADRFGLAALHQLRGRVGRSSLQSYCFLVFDGELTEDGKERLGVMKETNDGFRIAERDLAIRGPGEMTGNRQSGFLKLRFASLTEDADLVEMAKEEADSILSRDRGLISGENAVLRKALMEQNDRT